MPVNTTIKIRKGSDSEWNQANPILDLGEPGFDTTNNILKIGNGSSTWENLSGININGIGSGNYIAKFIDADTIGNSIIFDNGSSVGIGLENPTSKFQVFGIGAFGEPPDSVVTIGYDMLGSDLGVSTQNEYLAVKLSDGTIRYGGDGGDNVGIVIGTDYNLGIGTVSPIYKLDVNGTTRITGEITAIIDGGGVT